MSEQDRRTLDIDYHTGPYVSADLVERMAAWNDVREKCPVSWNEHGGGFWMFADYNTVRQVSRDAEVFLHRYDPEPEDGVEYIGVVTVPRPQGLTRFILGESDGPFHSALRAGLNPAFTPTTARADKPFVEQATNWLIDKVIETGEVEFIDDIIAPVTAINTLHMLGLPLEHWPAVSDVFHRVAGHQGDPAELAQLAATKLPQLMDMFVRECRDRRGNPRADVASVIARIEYDGKPLGDEELGLVVYNLVAGGVDTTTGFTGLALKHLDADHDSRQALIGEPGKWDTATEEFLRLYGTVPSLARTAASDCVVGGQDVSRGDHMVIVHAAANRDPAEFENPNQFDIDRKRNRHVSFGLSAHRCLGSHVARVVFQTMTSAILERMPDYRIDHENTVEYAGGPSVLGVWKLPASFTPGASRDTPSPLDA